MSNEQFFNPIIDSDKYSILNYIQNNNAECVVKIFDSHWKTHFLKTKKNNLVIHKKSHLKIQSEKIVVSFESVGDYFFFESTASNEDEQIIVTIPDKIYKLQRRNDFRVTIPLNVKPIIKIKNYSDLKTEIRDLSLGGCKIAIKTEFKLDLDLDSAIDIHIKVLDFEEKQLLVHIKFVEYIETAKTMILGLQFTELNSEQTTLMRSTLLQIDRLLRHKTED